MERKRSSAAWVAVLAPGVAVLPGLSTQWAGMGGWLAPVAALPAALLVGKLLENFTVGAPMADVILETAGRPVGRALTFIYIMWAVLLAAARLRRSGVGLCGALGAPDWLCPTVVAAMALWLARGEEGAFLRTAAVFGRVLVVALGGVLLLTLAQVRPEHLLPLWAGDVVPILRAAVPALGILCYGVYSAFLKEDGAGGWGIAALCGLLALLVAAVTGNLGAELTARLEDPFLTLSRQVGVTGAFQRIEGLLSALLVLGDLTLVGLLLRACRAMAVSVWSPAAGRWMPLAVIAGALTLALTAFGDGAMARVFEWQLAPWGNLVLGVAVPAALLWRKKAHRPG